MGRGLPLPYPALETHPGRGSASKSFSVRFFIVLGSFCAFSCVFLCFGGFLRVFACFSALGVPLGALGALLGALGTLLGRSWDALGCSWELLGRSWSALGALLSALGTLLGKNAQKSHGAPLFLSPTWSPKSTQVG